MFKFIEGSGKVLNFDSRYVFIWLNNLPISHGSVAHRQKLKGTVEHGGFCQLNPDKLDHMFFTAYGEAPSIGCSVEGLDVQELNIFLKNGKVLFDSQSAQALIVDSKQVTGNCINYREMTIRYSHIITELLGKNNV